MTREPYGTNVFPSNVFAIGRLEPRPAWGSCHFGCLLLTAVSRRPFVRSQCVPKRLHDSMVKKSELSNTERLSISYDYMGDTIIFGRAYLQLQ